MTNSTVLHCLQDAIDVLARVPTLQGTVSTLIRTCHVLKPENDSYDVSHSDPRTPFSAFVSVPRKRGPTDALRVAESLVHEAMHLQLTLIERLLPLVKESDLTYFSPWKGTQRSPRGVLHALYVFRAIHNFFGRLLTLPGWRVSESAKKCGAIRQRMPRSRVSCPVHGSGGTLLTLANCLSTTVSITLSTIPVEAPDCYSGVGWPSVDHVAIYPHESGTAPHFLALPKQAAVHVGVWSQEHVAEHEHERFREIAERELLSLHERNFARYRVRPSEFAAWQEAWARRKAASEPGTGR